MNVCAPCWRERAEACANCEKLTPKPEAQQYWCCPCGENPEWELTVCPVCGRLRPDLLKSEVDKAREWYVTHS